jgi:RNA polymerase sigma-70 factor (ECF subfamily)
MRMVNGSGEEQRLQFEEHALPHAKSLLRTALRLMQSACAAEDLVQETLLSAWRSFASFELGTDCKAWLFRIMLNGSSRERMNAQRRCHMFTTLGDAETYAAVTRVRGASSLLSWEIDVMLKSLPEEQRVVLLLTAVEGFTCKEISEITNAPLGTVMSRLSRARSTMRERLMPGGVNAGEKWREKV